MTVKLVLRPAVDSGAQALEAAEAWTDQGGEYEWALFSFVGEPLGSGLSGIEALRTHIQTNGIEDVWLDYLVPASEVTSCQAEIPAKQRRFILQALPYAVEEALAEDVETLHLVLGEPLDANRWQVLAIDRAAMAQHYALASHLPWTLHGIYTDAEACPAPDDRGLSLVFDGDAALVRRRGRLLLRTRPDNLAIWLALAVQSPALRGDVSSPAEIDGEGASAESAVEAAAAALAPLVLHAYLRPEDRSSHSTLFQAVNAIHGLECIQHDYQATPFELLAQQVAQRDDLTNLCQGEYRSQSDAAAGELRRWWPVAAVAGVLLLLQVGLYLTEGLLLQRQADQYRSQAHSLYTDIFPQERVVASPRRQMEGKLRARGDNAGNADFLALLAESGYQLRQIPDSDSVALNNVQFSQQRGELALDITAASPDQLDRYKQSLLDAGLDANLGSARREGEGVRGRLTIGEIGNG